MKKNYYQIEIRMFGEFDIKVNGESLLNNLTRLPVIIELLQYMVANYDKELLPSTIVEDIWPEKVYLDANKALRTYIYRLKKFLQEDNILGVDLKEYIYITNVRGRYVLNVSEECDFDIREFERKVKKSSKSNKLVISDLEEITSIYKGDFLQNTLYTHWAIPHRNMYLNKFININKEIIKELYDQNDFKEVIKYCEQVFEIYDLDETANLYFLKSLLKDDRVYDALQHYSYITSKMYTELNIKPSAELKEIYNSLKNPIDNSILIEEDNNIIEEVLPQTVQTIMAKKLPRSIKKYKLDAQKNKTVVGFLRLDNFSTQNIFYKSSIEIFDEVKEFLDIIFLKDYQCSIFGDIFIFYIRDEKEDFVSLVTEQIRKFINVNFRGSVMIDLKVNIISDQKESIEQRELLKV